MSSWVMKIKAGQTGKVARHVNDLSRVPLAGQAGGSEQRLAGSSYHQSGRITFNVDPIDIQPAVPLLLPWQPHYGEQAALKQRQLLTIRRGSSEEPRAQQGRSVQDQRDRLLEELRRLTATRSVKESLE